MNENTNDKINHIEVSINFKQLSMEHKSISQLITVTDRIKKVSL